MVRPIAIMVGAAIIAWTAAMWVHSAGAASFHQPIWYSHTAADSGEEKEPSPKWKIVLALDTPDRHAEFTYGDPTHGPHWYATQEECDKARKGGDKELARMLLNLLASIKKEHIQAVVALECRTDNSV